MRASTNAFLAAVAVVSLIGGAQRPAANVPQLSGQPRIIQPHVPTTSVQRPAIDVRPALWTDRALPGKYQSVTYAGDCVGGSCSILGTHRSVSGGGPVRQVFHGFRDRRPLRRIAGGLLGRLRCR